MSRPTEFVVEMLLKKDAFSETQAGHLADDVGTRLVRRRLDRLPLGSRAVGRYLARREARALMTLRDIPGVPKLIKWDVSGPIRSWIDGTPLHQVGRIDRRWADDAHRLLRQMHRRGVTHNDLAKPQNWLVTPDGRAAIIDMQLAAVHRARGRLFRIERYEDLRHLLKQKRRFAPELLTPAARRVLERRSLPSRFLRATAKPVYNLVTRGLLNWSDNEGQDKELVTRSDAIRASLIATHGVRGAAVVAFPRSGGSGLYAFVETESQAAPRVEVAPDLLQLVGRLPRSPCGTVRLDLLRLVAENRVEELESIIARDPDLAGVIKPIVEKRLNLTDRFIR